MNTRVLEKAITALNQDVPDISYIRGLLETLVEMSRGDTISPVYPSIQPAFTPYPVNNPNDPAIYADERTDIASVYHSSPGNIAI